MAAFDTIDHCFNNTVFREVDTREREVPLHKSLRVLYKAGGPGPVAGTLPWNTMAPKWTIVFQGRGLEKVTPMEAFREGKQETGGGEGN